MVQVYAVHEHELREGASSEQYEQEVHEALGKLQVPGLVTAIHLKGFKGKRSNKYGVLWIFTDENSLEENFGTPENPKLPEDWLHYENDILSQFLDRHPDKVDYTDYHVIKEFQY